MRLKRRAIPLPDLAGRTVLDVGCDFGYWSFLAAELGASVVMGVDRGRQVRGHGVVDLIAQFRAAAAEANFPGCELLGYSMDIGREWHEIGQFDVVFCFSVYHHIVANAGGHEPVWYWLHRRTHPSGVLLWENPVDRQDSVSRRHVPESIAYDAPTILEVASRYFEVEYVGPALHEPHRQVWRCRPRALSVKGGTAQVRSGHGGAGPAFEYRDGRRMDEIERLLGFRPFPGSLNLQADTAFNWERRYYRAALLDVVNRRRGLDSPWAPRPVRFYPLTVDGVPAYALRFEGENYSNRLVELIAPVRLRDHLKSAEVTLCR